MNIKKFRSKPVKLPKHTQRRIYWQRDDDGRIKSASVWYLVGYCPDTLAYFNALCRDAKKHFPELDQHDITCGKIRKSSCVEGFTFITFDFRCKAMIQVPGFSNYEGYVTWGY